MVQSSGMERLTGCAPHLHLAPKCVHLQCPRLPSAPRPAPSHPAQPHPTPPHPAPPRPAQAHSPYPNPNLTPPRPAPPCLTQLTNHGHAFCLRGGSRLASASPCSWDPTMWASWAWCVSLVQCFQCSSTLWPVVGASAFLWLIFPGVYTPDAVHPLIQRWAHASPQLLAAVHRASTSSRVQGSVQVPVSSSFRYTGCPQNVYFE